MDNVERLFRSVFSIMVRKPKDIESIKFWVSQFRHTADHEVSDKDKQKVINRLKKAFGVK